MFDQDPNIDLFTVVKSDFEGLAPTATTEPFQLAGVTGSGAVSKLAQADDRRNGVVILTAGTTAASTAQITTPQTEYRLSGFSTRYQAVFRIPTLSDGTNTFGTVVGLFESDIATGIFARIGNAGALTFESQGTVDTVVANSYVVLANTWYRLRILVNPNMVPTTLPGSSQAGGIPSGQFYGAILALYLDVPGQQPYRPVAYAQFQYSALPTGATDFCAPAVAVLGTAGTAATRLAHVDKIWFEKALV
jgi:SO2946-like, C-terminal domain